MNFVLEIEPSSENALSATGAATSPESPSDENALSATGAATSPESSSSENAPVETNAAASRESLTADDEPERIFEQAVTCDGNTWYPCVADHVTKVGGKYYSAILTKYYEETAFVDHGVASMEYKRRDPLITELVKKSKEIKKTYLLLSILPDATTTGNSNAIKRHCNSREADNGTIYDPACYERRKKEPAINGVWPAAKQKAIRIEFQNNK
uniref:Uncharacterized protein n=1 Tax=Tetranychus urticae TaxID=32264 RepID=T1K430_TETUR